MEGLENHTALHVTIYPVAWRVEIVDEGVYHGSEYVRSELDTIQRARIAH